MPGRPHPAARTCRSCGREMTWRKSWERTFEEVQYCSSACRRRRVSAADALLEQGILAALRARSGGGPVDPDSLVVGERESVRRAVRRLAARGEVQVVQGGRVVDPSRARGPIGVRLTS